MIFKSILFIMMVIFYGCIPVPTIPHGLGPVLSKEAVKSFQLNETTRADVLLAFGEPKYRLEDDQYFMYEWLVSYGYSIWSLGPGSGGVIPIVAPHYLCLEFGQDSRLIRIEELTGPLFSSNPDKAILQCTKRLEENK